MSNAPTLARLVRQGALSLEVGLFSKLRNLGQASSKMLASAGILSEEQLRDMGSVSAYIAVKAAGFKPSLNLLWAIEGALTDRDWKEVSRSEKTSLLIQLDDYERQKRAT